VKLQSAKLVLQVTGSETEPASPPQAEPAPPSAPEHFVLSVYTTGNELEILPPGSVFPELSSSIAPWEGPGFPACKQTPPQRLLYLHPASLCPAYQPGIQPSKQPPGHSKRCQIDESIFVHVLLGEQGSAIPPAWQREALPELMQAGM